ncbi:hypothetical protein AK830_g853 [Neonectria ditissima]|uniref:Uncharacterized protein n=1 Tax=Neonectria ditissima TaxID=78410 RepID=A0A0P7BVJ2_9HYPO|nr:hypothetical protein AK830_g853 [Neonectria ditissima]
MSPARSRRLRGSQAVRRSSRLANITRDNEAESHQSSTDRPPSPTVPRHTGVDGDDPVDCSLIAVANPTQDERGEHATHTAREHDPPSGTDEAYEISRASHAAMAATARAPWFAWGADIAFRVREADTVPEIAERKRQPYALPTPGIDETYEIARAPLATMTAAPGVPRFSWGADITHTVKETDTVPGIAERKRRPYALNLHHLYTMVSIEPPKRYKVAHFVYPINCSADWAKHTIDFVCYGKQKFTAIWEIWQVTWDEKQWARVLFLNIQPWIQLRDLSVVWRFFHPCFH